MLVDFSVSIHDVLTSNCVDAQAGLNFTVFACISVKHSFLVSRHNCHLAKLVTEESTARISIRDPDFISNNFTHSLNDPGRRIPVKRT